MYFVNIDIFLTKFIIHFFARFLVNKLLIFQKHKNSFLKHLKKYLFSVIMKENYRLYIKLTILNKTYKGRSL